jgi:hypothetical protein
VRLIYNEIVCEINAKRDKAKASPGDCNDPVEHYSVNLPEVKAKFVTASTMVLHKFM